MSLFLPLVAKRASSKLFKLEQIKKQVLGEQCPHPLRKLRRCVNRSAYAPFRHQARRSGRQAALLTRAACGARTQRHKAGLSNKCIKMLRSQRDAEEGAAGDDGGQSEGEAVAAEDNYQTLHNRQLK